MYERAGKMIKVGEKPGLVLQFVSFIPFLFVFWPTLRFAGFSYFDLSAPLAIIAIFMFGQRDKDVSIRIIQTALIAIIVLGVSGAVSLLTAADVKTHIIRIVTLLLALSTMVFTHTVLLVTKFLVFLAF